MGAQSRRSLVFLKLMPFPMTRRFQFSLRTLFWLMAAVAVGLLSSPAFSRRVDHDLVGMLWPVVLIWGAYEFRGVIR
jgi:hypothetical protein